MYRYRVQATLNCTLIEGQKRTKLDCQAHLPHGTLISTTHPNVYRSTLETLAKFMAKRQQVGPIAEAQVEVRLRYTIETEQAHQLIAVATVRHAE